MAAVCGVREDDAAVHVLLLLIRRGLEGTGLEVVARVENLDDRIALTMKTRLGAAVSTCSSLVPVFRGANWMERECYDMFGIRFEGHPICVASCSATTGSAIHSSSPTRSTRRIRHTADAGLMLDTAKPTLVEFDYSGGERLMMNMGRSIRPHTACSARSSRSRARRSLLSMR
jgi:hypothetical protein